MDPRSSETLFSRGASPPPQMYQQPTQPSQPQPTTSINVDSLFNLTDHDPSSLIEPEATQPYSSDFTSIMAHLDRDYPNAQGSNAQSSSSANVQATNTERQNALLSLLESASPASIPASSVTQNPPTNVPAPIQHQPPMAQQQLATPPGSAQPRINTTPQGSNESQGQLLLNQLLMGTNPSRSTFGESPQRASGSSLPSASAPSPPYASSIGSNQREDQYRSQYNPNEYNMSQPQAQQPQPQQQPQASPPKSLFEHTTAFDALQSVKKRNANASSSISSTDNNPSASSWTAVSDPKRQSVEDLLDQLTRQPSGQAQSHYNTGPSYLAQMAEPIQPQQAQTRGAVPPPPPLPPKPTLIDGLNANTNNNNNGNSTVRLDSPRSSPPKVHQRAQQPQQGNGNNNRRDKESSPVPRPAKEFKKGNGNQNAKNKNTNSQNQPTNSQAQTIVFDVSLAQDEIQSPREAVKTTAIALVKQESVYLPGRTIGATNWIAYAMTRGRVRVISRTSGDRTLLQLPSMFNPMASIVDMAVYERRLAGVTSDGGFVVWELPDTITDDVPGEIMLTVNPSMNPAEALHSVKWHPRDPDTLAIASNTNVYLVDLTNTHSLRGSLLQSELHHVGQVFPVPSPVVAFDFDMSHFAIATVSEDSTLTSWSIHDRTQFYSTKVRGEDRPSSLTFIDGGLVVGRKNGTIFQLLSSGGKSVLSTIKFINGTQQEDPDMFGHINYDARVQAIWIANSRRESLIAFKVGYDSSHNSPDDPYRASFEQVIEFSGSKPTLHFVILDGNSDPHGEEAEAACLAAKVPVSDLALVAFSVHSQGVDQILVRKDSWEQAGYGTVAKFPVAQPMGVILDYSTGKRPQQQQQQQPFTAVPQRMRTPPVEDFESDLSKDNNAPETGKSASGKKRNVNWDKNEGSGNAKEKKNDVQATAAAGTSSLNDSALGQISRDIKKTEESIHTKLSRLISKEMDKQQQRMEEARVKEEGANIARQETILRLISAELTHNTTRVVEKAIKTEVQTSVLPALERMTQIEVRAALNDQVGHGLVDFISDSLPIEIEKLLVRPDISNHFALLLSNNLNGLLERQMKDAITKTFLPMYSNQAASMQQEVLRELRSEVHGMKSDMHAWQSEAFRNQENTIRDLEHTVRKLTEQVKFLSSVHSPQVPLHHLPPQQQQHPSSGSAGNAHNLRQNMVAQQQPAYGQVHPANFQTQPQQPLPTITGWYNSPGGIAAPQASHPASIPQPPPQVVQHRQQPQQVQQVQQQQQHMQQQRTPPVAASESWDDSYLAVLQSDDMNELRKLLSRTNPELVLPLRGEPLLSQAVILTLVHRLSSVLPEVLPTDESFSTSLWWLQRSVALLEPMDKLILDFIPRVLPGIMHSLTTVKQRLLVPLGGSPDAARTLAEILDTLKSKIAPLQL